MGQDASCSRTCCTEYQKPVHWDETSDKQYQIQQNESNLDNKNQSLKNSEKKAKRNCIETDQEEFTEGTHNFHNEKSIVFFQGNKDIFDIKKSCLKITNHLVMTQSQQKKFSASKEITLTSSIYNLNELKEQQSWRWMEVSEICDLLLPTNINEFYVEYDSEWHGAYLVSALNILSCKPVYLLRMFETKSHSTDSPEMPFNNTLQSIESGSKEIQFFVHILQNGIIQKINIDNNIPCCLTKDQSLYLSSLTYAFAPLFLKAYSCLYGGYKNIQKGIFGQLLRDITWAPYEYISITDAQTTFNYITQSLEKKYIVTLSKQLDNSWTDCVLCVQQESNTNKVLVKRGQDGSQRWIHFNDLNQIYNFCGVNKCNEEYYYSYITQNVSTRLNKEIFIVQLESSQNINHTFLTVTQQDKRLFLKKNTEQTDFSYDFVRMILVKGSLNSVNRQMNIEKWVDDLTQVGRDSTIECFLNQGTYLLYVEVEQSTHFQTKISINSYSQEKIHFQFSANSDLLFPNLSTTPTTSLSNFNSSDPLEQRLIDKFIISKTKNIIESNQNCHNYPEDRDISRLNGFAAGNLFFIYENNSTQGSVIRERYRIRKRNDPIFNKEWKIELKPKERQIISFPLQKGEHLNDIIIDLIYNDITLQEKKILLNIRQIPQCEKVQKEQRMLNGNPVSSFLYTYTYSGGYALYFENFTNYQCTETLYYQIENLKGDEFGEEEKSIIFIINSGQSKLFNLKRIDPLKSANLQIQSVYSFHP